MLDDRLETPSSSETIAEVVFARPDIRLAWAAVLGDRFGTDDVHPYSAPGRATDLTDLPDTFVAVAQFDLLRDEGIDFAHAADHHAACRSTCISTPARSTPGTASRPRRP